VSENASSRAAANHDFAARFANAFPRLAAYFPTVPEHRCLNEVIHQLARAATGNRPDLYGAPPPAADLDAALLALSDRRRLLDHDEQRLIEARLDAGGTWAGVADALGLRSADAARHRYRRLGGTRTWPAGRRAGK
jgi:hypothetical protein